ncbi:rod shape-determining protein RodA [Candidatus Woesebacteria bacterium]|nr:rod shape-determining protein RodA [Candidatus Woesebacteria bacterium]
MVENQNHDGKADNGGIQSHKILLKVYRINVRSSYDYLYVLAIIFLLLFGIVTLVSIAPFLFPFYFFYVIAGIVVFLIFSRIDFEVISLFSKYFYIGSIIFLILPLLIGQVTRGTIRWIPLGPVTIQPSELVRPFILVFFANFLADREISPIKAIISVILFIPVFLLIVVQPSLGIAVITGFGLMGILLSCGLDKKFFLTGLGLFVVLIPLAFNLTAPYQKLRVLTFLDPFKDPFGAGYNSLQAKISVGSGELFGRGLGKGVQTQLAFLPERHTDFIFASIAEELGFVGAGLLIGGSFFIFWKLTSFMENPESKSARNFLAGLFATLFLQTVIHVGMNIGLLPITGVPYPLVSAGGSSLVATMIGLGIALKARKT